MATEEPVVLPYLTSPETRYNAVPRRYEETRPVVVQNFAHRKIIGLGCDIHSKVIESCRKEKEVALRATEDAVWSEAEALKKQELERALARQQTEHERTIKKLQKIHERTVKETALRVEGEMQKRVLEEVQREKDEGEQRLQIAVLETEKRCHQQLLQAVSQARTEEQNAAAKQAVLMADKHTRKLTQALHEAALRQVAALQDLEGVLQREKREAVDAAHQQEQQIATEKLERQRDLYEQQIQVLKTHIIEHKGKIQGLKKEIVQMKESRNQVEAELLETRIEFSKFISSVKPFNEGESDFLIPPIQSFDLAAPEK